MATTTYPNKLIAGSNLGLADANDIVYSTKEVSAGDGETVAIKDKSVLDKLNDIEQAIDSIDSNSSADNVIYENNISVKSAIDTLNNRISSFDGDIEDATAAKNLAQAAAQNAQTYATNAENSANSLNDLREDIQEIKDIADTFATAFDADAAFAIISEQEYQQLPQEDLVKNCIYFCYQ